MELTHVSIHRTEDSFKMDLPRILPFHRAAVVLEAPTSKAKVLLPRGALESFS